MTKRIPSNIKTLRRVVRNILLEGLRFEEDLMILNHPKSPTLYLLCDANWEIAVERGNLDKEKFFETNMLAMIQVKPPRNGECNYAMEIKKSGAIEGYGPTLYDCVMELTDGIINDRQSVSDAAKTVMDRYRHGRPDVEKKLLDNIEDTKTYPRTPDTSDDCTPGDMVYYEDGVAHGQRWEDDPLSYSYNKPLSPTVAQWKQKGDDFINQMEATGNLFYTDLRVWAREMFDQASISD